MYFLKLSLTSILAFILTWFFTKIFISNVSNKLISKPNHRSSHKDPIPQGGGLIFLLIASASSLILGNSSLVIGCIPIGIIGFLDDFYKINPLARYIAQLFTVIYLINNQGIPNYGMLQNSVFFAYFLSVLLIIFFTAIINFVNFMDGIDGLVAINFIIFLFVSSINISLSFLPLMMMMMGFIIWNWNPAKVFMGDTGSTFLGSITVLIFLENESLINAFFLILVITPLLFDAFSCVIRRLIAGQNIFRPHKLHLYQRLHQAGWSHGKVSLIYGIASCILSILFLLSKYKLLIFTALLAIFVGIFLDKRFAKPFNLKV